jgi:predicted nuclease of restriction endonuclease-like RecB superfamily
MRANVAGDRAALARAKIAKDIECRKCRVQKETLGHILGQCTSTKKERIARHDTIKDFIIQKIADHDKEAAITREPTLRTPNGGVLKPDLVIKNQRGVFVVDVTVRHEDRDYLQEGRSKIEKYAPLLPELKQRLQGETAEVLPIVVGTRGALPQNTVEALDKLSINGRSDLLTISLTAFRKSIDIYNNFMDYNAHPRASIGRTPE